MKIAKYFIRTAFILIPILLIGWLAGFAWFSTVATGWKAHDLSIKSDALIVLTGGEGRLDEGLNLFAAERAPYLFVTSVHNKFDEQRLRLRWKGQTQLPECCIVLDHEADSTAENAMMARNWIQSSGHDIQTIRLVTSNYHMPRAYVDFQRIMPDVVIYPHPIVSPKATSQDRKYWSLLISEYNKYLVRIVQTWLPLSAQEALS